MCVCVCSSSLVAVSAVLLLSLYLYLCVCRAVARVNGWTMALVGELFGCLCLPAQSIVGWLSLSRFVSEESGFTISCRIVSESRRHNRPPQPNRKRHWRTKAHAKQITDRECVFVGRCFRRFVAMRKRNYYAPAWLVGWLSGHSNLYSLVGLEALCLILCCYGAAAVKDVHNRTVTVLVSEVCFVACTTERERESHDDDDDDDDDANVRTDCGWIVSR